MPTKVLIVLDGSYRFANGAMPASSQPDFTYAVLADALVAAGMDVTKAHRGADSTATPGWTSFRFDALPAGRRLDEFDAIWLIGNNGQFALGLGSTGALPDDELAAIANYMDNQGGVFATGDHSSIGAEMCGKIPRVRAMRRWYGEGDPAGTHLVGIPHNFPPTSSERADTTQPSAHSDYSEFPAPFIWFENQSDAVPQPIVLVAPTHPILRRDGRDILVFPDHMHEGDTLEPSLTTYNYEQDSPFGDTSRKEFRTTNMGHRVLPQVIARGRVLGNVSRRATTGRFTFEEVAGVTGTGEPATAREINLLSVYDGRAVGVGRIVTGSTFHHYVDINLDGDSSVISTEAIRRAGADAQDGRGFNANMNPEVFRDIKAVFVNITNWIARPKPAIQMILERSTFSQDEAPASSVFAGVLLVTVDGVKPNQFPGGVPVLGAISGTVPWAPRVNVASAPIVAEPSFVSSDDPSLPDRVQRFTFKYRLRFTGDAFDFTEEFRNVVVDGSFTPAISPAPLTDSAFIQLVKSANPFMLDLEDSNETSWLSSDVKVFRVIEGEPAPVVGGAPLPVGASRQDVLDFLRDVVGRITSTQFTALSGDPTSSALSEFPRTTSTGRRVYNFALARVRLDPRLADANGVRVFFRVFTTQTTAALTYRESAPGVPIEGYAQTSGASPLALPGRDAGGNWVSFPCFADPRRATPDTQVDPRNLKDVPAREGVKIFGALLDNNLDEPYPGLNPGAAVQPTMRSLFNGVHQCLVAQIAYGPTRIPSGATPWTSDKLSQRNIAVVQVANPGLDASRTASHTFEIEATLQPSSDQSQPDELLLDWSEKTPDGTSVRLYIPSWNAQQVVELADRIYSRHEIEAIDAHTIEMPAGGMRYIPIPLSPHRQNGVISVEFPLGIKKGQRFDVSVRQISTRSRGPTIPQPKFSEISLQDAQHLIAELPGNAYGGAQAGSVVLDKNRVLMTDLSALDVASDRGVIIEYPDPAAVEAAQAASRTWRETIGAFQLGMPVSTKKDMLLDHMRTLSVMRWRLAQLPRQHAWRKTLQHDVEQMIAKVQALGGNPFDVPATSDGAIPQLPWAGTDDGPDRDKPPGTKQSFGMGLFLGFLIALVVLLLILLIYRG
jgi:hypothetical protein